MPHPTTEILVCKSKQNVSGFFGVIGVLFCCKLVTDCASNLYTNLGSPVCFYFLKGKVSNCLHPASVKGNCGRQDDLSFPQRLLPANWPVFSQILDSWQGGF